MIQPFETASDLSAYFYPEGLRDQIDNTIQDLYTRVNNGRYWCRFSRSQEAYDEAADELFSALNYYENILSHQRYVHNDILALDDWCFFPTLIPFDPMHYAHSKSNVRCMAEYPSLWNYPKDPYQVPGVAERCNFVYIKERQYSSHESVDPTRLVPRGPSFTSTNREIESGLQGDKHG